MEYRKATLEDLDELLRLRLDMRRERETVYNLIDEENFRRVTEGFFLASISNESFVAWIAVEGENIVASSGMSFYSVPPTYKNLSGKVAYLMNMYTQPEYRNQGIASDLVKKMIREAKDRGCSKIVLNASVMGRPIYEKNGFQDMENEMVLYVD